MSSQEISGLKSSTTLTTCHCAPAGGDSLLHDAFLAGKASDSLRQLRSFVSRKDNSRRLQHTAKVCNMPIGKTSPKERSWTDES